MKNSDPVKNTAPSTDAGATKARPGTAAAAKHAEPIMNRTAIHQPSRRGAQRTARRRARRPGVPAPGRWPSAAATGRGPSPFR